MTCLCPIPPRLALAAALITTLNVPMPALGQSMLQACGSDGYRVAPRLLERFMAADCQACWTDDPRASENAEDAVVLDWITPGAMGDDAPLSAAATRDGLHRLQALHAGLAPPTGAQPASGLLRRVTPLSRATASAGMPRLSIARGPAMRGYVGVSVALTAGRAGPWQVWLALVERIAAGEEGSPVARQLVRSSLAYTRDARRDPLPSGQAPWIERRVMRIPEGANTEQLQLVGWVEDAQGRMMTLAQTRCAP